MRDIIENLVGLGLEEREAEIYLNLVEIGLSSIQDIAKKTGVKRTTLYYIIDHLVKLGFVIPSVIEKKTLYKAENPEIVLKGYHEKIQGLIAELPKLQDIYDKKHKESGQVSFLNGEEGFKKIWQILFSSGAKEYIIITDPREMLGFVRKNYITGKVITQKVKLGIRSRQLLNHSEYAKEVVVKDREENRISKFLPYDRRIFFTKIIFGDNVAFISPNAEEVILLIFQNRALARTEKELFESLWEALPEIDYEKLRAETERKNKKI
ncbi:MAG: hypothetical protein NTW50_04345 [Candidatus Berkelbacteria bacterium]|nr:hypothetical protein [Candidatus Berkelbacteria bacterium]